MCSQICILVKDYLIVIVLNLYKPNGISLPYQLDDSILNLWVVG